MYSSAQNGPKRLYWAYHFCLNLPATFSQKRTSINFWPSTVETWLQRTRLIRILALIGESHGPNGGDQGAAGLVKADIGDSGGIAAALSNRDMRSTLYTRNLLLECKLCRSQGCMNHRLNFSL